LGLAVGIAACLLIFLVIRFETSFDNFHKKKDNIYRVSTEFRTQDGVSYAPGVALPVAPQIRLDFPQIKEVACIFRDGDGQVTIRDEGSNQQKKLYEGSVYYAEPEFFEMFDFGFITGNPRSSLAQPNNVVLTRQVAEKYFGDWKQATGKSILLNNKYTLKVTGILEDIPANSDFPLGLIVSYSTLKTTNFSRNLNDWVSTFSEAYTFVVLPHELPQDKFNEQLRSFARKHKPAEYAQDVFIARPLTEMHYSTELGNFRGHTFSRSLINSLVLIGIFLIVIACVNFVNLATAQAVNRSREVGVRKVLGSNRKQLVVQFLSETALIVIASVVVAIIIAEVALPFLNTLLEVKMSGNFLDGPLVLIFLAGIIVVVTILSGFYPAIILSGFNPIAALKSKITSKMVGGISLKRGLVIVQFAIAHVLIIGMLVVVSQMNYFNHASLGFDKASIVNVPIPGDSISHLRLNALRDRLAQNPGIKTLSFSYASPSANGNWSSDFKFDNSAKATNFSANLKWADTGYFNTYHLQFLAGRAYYPSDTANEYVVNQTLLRKLGITDPRQALGKKIDFWDGGKVGYIVGVVNDFNSYSLRDPMAPVVLSNWKDVYQTINIKLIPGREKQTLAFIERLWNETFPDYVYQYNFLDDTIRDFYRQENQLSVLYRVFAALAIFISCLGLYGLVSFMVVQRTREVGIRKVLGASAKSIVYLLSREFTVLIVIAFVIAGPVAYYVMHKWLQNYTYRIDIGVMIFGIAIISSMLVAWLTVGHRAVKAALANPVRSLRSE
jgi:predicted permease